MTALPMSLMTDEEVARFGRDRESGFGALRTDRGLLPLVAMDVEARVAGVIASIELAQTFVNTTGVPIEATYIFPLPDRAAVHRFTMEVAGRIVDGVVEERGAARQQYDQAIAQGHRAAITEEERAGVFTLRVGNLMPGEAATVRLALVGPLPIDDGEVTFRFPLVVAPRYIPGAQLGGEQAGVGVAPDTNLVPDASRISPPVLLPGYPNPVRLGMRVTLEDRDLRDIASSLHAVTTGKRDGLVVEVQPGSLADPLGARAVSAAPSSTPNLHAASTASRLDRDFILRWHVDGSALRSSLVCADDADGRAGTFMLTLVPPSTVAMASKPRDVVFVIDRSGSMGGWKMVAARRAAARMIDSLTSRDRFCAIAFDDVTDRLPAGSLVDATDRNRYRAVEMLGKVEARGGTEMAAPLQLAAKMLGNGDFSGNSFQSRERVIVLVTDGQVGNEDHILRELAPALRGIKMFALGIDQAVNAAFLKRLASAGGGLCELVESEDRLDVVMAKVHRRIGTPIATELAVRGVGLDLDPASIAPKKLPDVYAGAPVTILGRYRNAAGQGTGIEIEGTSLGDPMRETVVRAIDSSPAAWLAASWARAAIRDREDLYATGLRNGLEHEIVSLSKRYSVLSRFTAFLAIDRAEIANRTGYINQVVQPVEEPAGWANPPAKGRAAPMMNAPVARSPMAPASPMPMGQPGMMGSRRPGAAAPLPPAAPAPLPGYAQPTDSPPSFGGGAPAAPRSAPPMMPPAPPARGMRSRSIDKLAEEQDDWGESGPPELLGARKLEERPASRQEASPYLIALGNLARELEAQGRGRVDTAAIRLLRQRLTEWVEDLRSVGNANDLAAAVEQLVQRLSAALALSTDLANEAIAIAAELSRLAGGAQPPRAPGRAFWK